MVRIHSSAFIYVKTGSPDPTDFAMTRHLIHWRVLALSAMVGARVSYETSFDSKQPKLEPKLVSKLSETRCLFRLFRFCIETASFSVSIEPKQNKSNRNNPKKRIGNRK
jgi:hypothetical protein